MVVIWFVGVCMIGRVVKIRIMMVMIDCVRGRGGKCVFVLVCV